MKRVPRSMGERVSRIPAAYECDKCGHRHVIRRQKHCWRCGTDLDRRKRQTVMDHLASVIVLWPYSCRRCGKRRYRWGKRSGG